MSGNTVIVAGVGAALAAHCAHAGDPVFDFTNNQEVMVGKGPLELAVGDIDGDGDPDAITSNFQDDSHTVILNDGVGGYDAWATFAGLNGSTGLTLADLDSNGVLDLATVGEAAQSQASVAVYLNPTDWAAPESTIYDIGINAGPQTVRAGDMDGDGDLDLVTPDADAETISVFMNNGDGTFTTPVIYPTGELPWSVGLADLDGDGDIDVAVGSLTENQVRIYKNAGDGTLAPSKPATVAPGPMQIEVGDIDSDGDIDIIASSFFGGVVNLLFNDGDGTFTFVVQLGELGLSPGAAGGDFDNDGDLDIVATNYDTYGVHFFINDGLGTFTSFEEDAIVQAAQNPQFIIARDIDADGDIDVITANAGAGSVSIFFNNTPQGIVSDVDQNGIVDSGDLMVVVEAFGCTGWGCNDSPADTDADGDVDSADLNNVLRDFGKKKNG